MGGDYLDSVETYEVLVTGDTGDGEWIAMAEQVDWECLPSYLEPGVSSHELNRLEAECLETGELSDAYFTGVYSKGGSLE